MKYRKFLVNHFKTILHYRFTVIGVTSFGPSGRCGGTGNPGFARITPQVKAWIMSNAVGSQDSSLFSVLKEEKTLFFPKSDAGIPENQRCKSISVLSICL